jgi:putative Mg2+ transporter-C (MgtC) family protein
MEITTLDILIRLTVAGALSALIGLEREYRHRPAGLRTNAIVGIATALMTIVSVNIATLSLDPSSVDPSRIISNILVGIGFIGAGTIIQSRGIVKGLTTAATTWMVAGIGITVGLGMFPAAIIATVLILIILVALRNIQVEESEDRNEE